jgi:hypothetical protein
VLNRGVGLRFSGQDPPSTTIAIENNLVAGNSEGGLIAQTTYLGHIQQNDAWMNGGSGFQGIAGADENINVDPLFCDAANGEYRLATASPCAMGGVFGQIGSFGQGCEAMRVRVDVEPHSNNPINLGSNEPVDAAILGHALFDPHRVDIATVRLAGAPQTPRGEGGVTPRFEDVNDDGIDDLVLSFIAREMNITGSVADLEGRTLSNDDFVAYDSVLVIPASTAIASNASGSLSLKVPSPQRLGEFSILAALPKPGIAKLEMFDVSGRRVFSRQISAQSERRTMRMDQPAAVASGLYLVRMEHEGMAAVARVVLVR